MRTTAPGQSPLLLLDAVPILEKGSIPYAVIGAMALAFHGVIRASMDVDALIFLGNRPLEGLASEFRNAGFTVGVRWGDAQDPIPALMQLSDSFENRVDLLTGLRGLDAGTVSRTVSCAYEETPLHIVGLEDLIAMKLFAGSFRDIEDIRQLLSVSKERVDLPLLQQLALRFGRKERALLDDLL